MAHKRHKILLISVSAGAGHVRAAEALERTAQLSFPDLEIEHIDMMDYVSRPMKTAIVDSYQIMAKQLPELWRFVYKKTDRPRQSGYLRELTKVINRMNATRFYEYVEQTKPDQILATHFLPAHALLELPKKYKISAPISILMTDYDKHSLLITPGMKHYFVATDKMKWKMMHKNISEKQITLSGIPVDPIFQKIKSVTELKKKYKVNNGKKTILIMSGGQGMAKSDQIITTLCQTEKQVNLIAIAGSSTTLESKLEKIKTPSHIKLHVVGWTNKIDEYMRIADVVVTKPGGLSVSECIALEKPIVAIHPIPGQEEHNAEYILKNGFGVIAHTPKDLLYYTDQKGETLAPRYRNKKKQPIAGQLILNKLIDLKS